MKPRMLGPTAATNHISPGKFVQVRIVLCLHCTTEAIRILRWSARVHSDDTSNLHTPGPGPGPGQWHRVARTIRIIHTRLRRDVCRCACVYWRACITVNGFTGYYSVGFRLPLEIKGFSSLLLLLESNVQNKIKTTTIPYQQIFNYVNRLNHAPFMPREYKSSEKIIRCL